MFVFSDVEGSTELLKRLGDGYATLIADHRRIVRETFGARGGVEIDTQGDAFFFSFARARDAAAAAVEAQRRHAEHAWPNGERVRVRMGLHTGEPAVGEEGYLDALSRLAVRSEAQPEDVGRSRARIAAALGETERALAFLREGYGGGQGIDLHTDIDFQPAIEANADFREFVRPKG